MDGLFSMITKKSVVYFVWIEIFSRTGKKSPIELLVNPQATIPFISDMATMAGRKSMALWQSPVNDHVSFLFPQFNLLDLDGPGFGNTKVCLIKHVF